MWTALNGPVLVISKMAEAKSNITRPSGIPVCGLHILPQVNSNRHFAPLYVQRSVLSCFFFVFVVLSIFRDYG